MFMMVNAAPGMLRRVGAGLADIHPIGTPERDIAALFGALDILCLLGFVPSRWLGSPTADGGVDALLDELLDAAREIDEVGYAFAPAARTLAHNIIRMDEAICSTQQVPREWYAASEEWL